MYSEKVKILYSGDDRNYLIYSAIIRRNGVTLTHVELNVNNGDWVEKN